MGAKKKTKFVFEESIQQLELIVNQIEKGQLALTESLKLFAEGVGLTKKCQQALQGAEQKVQILLGDKLEEFKQEVSETTAEEDEPDGIC